MDIVQRQNKGTVRGFFDNIYSFFFNDFQNLVNFRKFENRENSPFCVETKIYDKKTKRNFKKTSVGALRYGLGILERQTESLYYEY